MLDVHHVTEDGVEIERLPLEQDVPRDEVDRPVRSVRHWQLLPTSGAPALFYQQSEDAARLDPEGPKRMMFRFTDTHDRAAGMPVHEGQGALDVLGGAQ